MKIKHITKKLGSRFCSVLLIVALLLGNLSVFADGEKREVAMSYTAKAAYLIEQDTGTVLFEQNSTQELAPASLTKLMDLILIYEAFDEGVLTPGQKLTCSSYAKTMGGSEIWLKEGEQMTVEDLLKALIVASANDAAVVFAEAIAVTEEAFVEKMNQKAQELGLVNTHFVNCTGFDEEGHYTCAQDVATMARELMTKHGEEITKYSTIWMDSLRGGATQLINTNKLLRNYQGITGLKTGTTGGAGICISASATRDGLSLIAVVLGSSTSEERFAAATALLDYGFANYEVAGMPDLSAQPDSLPVTGGAEQEVGVSYTLPEHLLLKKGEGAALEATVTLPESVAAPVQAGAELGSVRLAVGGEELGIYPITAKSTVEAMTFGIAFGRLWQALTSL